MSKSNPPAPIGFSAAPPPSAPPSYAQAMGGVPPQAPFTQGQIPAANAPPTIVTTIVPLGPKTTHMVCPHCQHEINTATKTSPSRTAWIASLIICCLGCPLGCCLIPFCIDDCMNTEHNCPKCKAFLGEYSKS